MAGSGPYGCIKCGGWGAHRSTRVCALCFYPPNGYQPRPGTRDAAEQSLMCYEAKLFERPGEVAVLTPHHLTADEQAIVADQLPVGVRPIFCSRSARHELPLFIWVGLLSLAFLAGWFACFWGWR